MASSFEKSVKGATKIKNAPPKTKYIEHILIATNAGETGVGEVFRTLQHRLRDSTWTVVLKSLITIHIMIREGSPDVTLAFLSRHRNMLSSGHLTDAQTQGRNIRHYSAYLSERARAFRDTKIDWVHAPPSRLEKLPVDKGLLRETETVQRQLSALVKCDVLENDPETEITIAVFRLLVLDVLALFHVLNQGLINILGHFFEMSKPDAERALDIYRQFTRQTDQVVQYLSVARLHEHHTRVEVPKLKHAPVTLRRELEDYLNDPNFDTHRKEYISQRDAKIKAFSPGAVSTTKRVDTDFPEPAPTRESNATEVLSTSAANPLRGTTLESEPLIDFFDSIEQNQSPRHVQLQQASTSNSGRLFEPRFTSAYEQPQAFSSQAITVPLSGQLQQQLMRQSQDAQSIPTSQTLTMQQPYFTVDGIYSQPAQVQHQSQDQVCQLRNVQPGLSDTSLQHLSPHFLSSNVSGKIEGSHFQLYPRFAPTPTSQTTNPFCQSRFPDEQVGAQGAFSPPNNTAAFNRQSTNPFARASSHIVGPSSMFSPMQITSPKSTPAASNPFSRIQDLADEPQQHPQRSVFAAGAIESTNPFRQGAFVDHRTGLEWQQNQALGGGVEQLPMVPVFQRPAQTNPWQQ